jgi:CubicO group peptidase (beta-lactamase class C family)
MTPSSAALPRTTPEHAGIPLAAVERLVDRLADDGLDPHALVIARGGEVAVEAAWAPYPRDRPALVYSASKTFTSLAIGLLAGEGRLSLDDSAGALLGRANPHGITVRHLLTMSTGHSYDQIEGFRFVLDALLSTPPADAPGSRFAYNSDATFALACIVTAVTGERLTDYLRPRLLDPLGIGPRWMAPLHGTEQGFSGYHVTVEDIARVGILLGAGGRWHGEQIVPAAYVEELSRAWADTSGEGDGADWSHGYGYQVWRSSRGFRLDGAYGQFGVVVPEQDLVIAYQGATSSAQRTLDAFWALTDELEPLDSRPVDAGGGAAAGTAVFERDSWSHRARFSPASDGRIDATGWSLEAAPGGWELSLPDGAVIPVGDGHWAVTVLRDESPVTGELPPQVESPPVETGSRVRLSSRGEAASDGSLLAHVVNTTSPHRLLVRRDPSGAVSAAWHTAPLQGLNLSVLRVPPEVAAD